MVEDCGCGCVVVRQDGHPGRGKAFTSKRSNYLNNWYYYGRIIID